ncbi:H-type small acid-soluble spore protein [Virgibacillus profundi]|uniref:Small, acid-soluble spore protein H n=1 Tax=Virgibacillus profundi TaxID=2024555 RepID=A0A2A2II09_9BACI|nr:H-type small acid-soluble spore protein [Virgibacillus profundi]PAV31631.1 H-type small acid-soluble spore protein [Virgibacillus profundi]PXY55817.1 H-type small acid-soluble spore protein [Virgibacillus profundi]
MDRQRAQEIMESIQMINVNYHGIPVYIQEIQTDHQSAMVFPLDEMDNEQIVDLSGLNEIPLVNYNENK